MKTPVTSRTARRAIAVIYCLLTGLTLAACNALSGGGSPWTPPAAISTPPQQATSLPNPQPTSLPSYQSTGLPTSPPTIAAPLPTVPAAPPTQPSPPVASPTPISPATAAPMPAPTSAPTARPVSPTPFPPPTAAPAIEIIVDDRDPGFSTIGAWFPGDGGVSFRDGCRWSPPGVGNIAYIRPELPLAGSYDLYAWGCGDPNHDQAYLTTVMVYPYRSGRYAPPQVSVNLKEDAGRWVPIGTYYFEPGGSLSIASPYFGNVAVDAFRFVYRTSERLVITPTPAPTRVPWTNHPPSPQEQLTSGDLSARLGLVQWLYPYTPAQSFEEMAFDDCQAFPRAGCGGRGPAGGCAWNIGGGSRSRCSIACPTTCGT